MNQSHTPLTPIHVYSSKSVTSNFSLKNVLTQTKWTSRTFHWLQSMYIPVKVPSYFLLVNCCQARSVKPLHYCILFWYCRNIISFILLAAFKKLTLRSETDIDSQLCHSNYCCCVHYKAGRDKCNLNKINRLPKSQPPWKCTGFSDSMQIGNLWYHPVSITKWASSRENCLRCLFVCVEA